MILSKKLSSLTPAIPALGWWIQVDHQNPIGIRYFGPYPSSQDAISKKQDCCQELVREGLHLLDCQIKFCQPRQLMINEKNLQIQDLKETSIYLFLRLTGH